MSKNSQLLSIDIKKAGYHVLLEIIRDYAELPCGKVIAIRKELISRKISKKDLRDLDWLIFHLKPPMVYKSLNIFPVSRKLKSFLILHDFDGFVDFIKNSKQDDLSFMWDAGGKEFYNVISDTDELYNRLKHYMKKLYLMNIKDPSLLNKKSKVVKWILDNHYQEIGKLQQTEGDRYQRRPTYTPRELLESSPLWKVVGDPAAKFKHNNARYIIPVRACKTPLTDDMINNDKSEGFSHSIWETHVDLKKNVYEDSPVAKELFVPKIEILKQMKVGECLGPYCSRFQYSLNVFFGIYKHSSDQYVPFFINVDIKTKQRKIMLLSGHMSFSLKELGKVFYKLSRMDFPYLNLITSRTFMQALYKIYQKDPANDMYYHRLLKDKPGYNGLSQIPNEDFCFNNDNLGFPSFNEEALEKRVGEMILDHLTQTPLLSPKL